MIELGTKTKRVEGKFGMSVVDDESRALARQIGCYCRPTAFRPRTRHVGSRPRSTVYEEEYYKV